MKFEDPSQVKNFIWRAATICLPTKDLLRSRSVEVNTLCHVCNIELETTLRSLVSFSLAQAYQDRTIVPTVSGMFNSFAEWLQIIFSQRKASETCSTVMLSGCCGRVETILDGINAVCQFLKL